MKKFTLTILTIIVFSNHSKAKDYFLCSDSLEYAIQYINSYGTVNILCDISIDSNLVVPKNVVLRFSKSASIFIPKNITLKINGGIEAAPFKIFDCENLTYDKNGVQTSGGKVIGGCENSYTVYTQWWGAAGDGISDDRNELQAAIDFAAQIKSKVIVGGAKESFLVDNTVYIRTNSNIEFFSYIKFDINSSTHNGEVVCICDRSHITDLSLSKPVFNVVITNPLIDGSNCGYLTNKGSGLNGIGFGIAENVRINGGEIINCIRGNSSKTGSGGRAINLEHSPKNVVINGTTGTNCTALIHAHLHSGSVNGFDTTYNDDKNWTFNHDNCIARDLVAKNCEILIQLNCHGQPRSPDTVYTNMLIDGIVAKNCGRRLAGLNSGSTVISEYGLFSGSFAGDVTIKNINILNDSEYGLSNSLFDFNTMYKCKFYNVNFNGELKYVWSFQDKPEYNGSYKHIGQNIFSNINIHNSVDYLFYSDIVFQNEGRFNDNIFSNIKLDCSINQKLTNDHMINSSRWNLSMYKFDRKYMTSFSAIFNKSEIGFFTDESESYVLDIDGNVKLKGVLNVNDLKLSYGSSSNSIILDGKDNLEIYVVDGTFDSEDLRFVVKKSGQIRLYPRSSTPSSAELGDMYFNSTDNSLYIYNGNWTKVLTQ